MNNKQSQNETKTKKIIKNILKIILIVIAIYLAAILIEIASRPIRNNIDKNNYQKLDTQLQILYKDLKKVSNSEENWQYQKSCTEQLSGPWPTGKYICTNSLFAEKNVTSVDEINQLQSKYYPVIDNNKIFTAQTQLDPEYPNDFGKKFVVSSAFKDYKEIKSKKICRYLISLSQSIQDYTTNNDRYGSDITNGIGKALIKIECTSIARGNWYGKY